MATVLAVCAGFGVLLAGTEILHRRFAITAETTRRLAHIGSGLGAAAIMLVLTLDQAAVVAALFVALLLVSRRFHILRSVHDVERQTWGELFFPLGLLVLTQTAADDVVFVFAALVMGLGDGLAGAVGARERSHRFRVGRASKSVEGSITMFLVTVVLGWVMLIGQGVPAGASAIAGALVGAVLTAVEAVLPNGVDNLVLPVAAGALFEAVQRFT